MKIKGTITLVSEGSLNEYEVNGHSFFCSPYTNQGITRKLKRSIKLEERTEVWFRDEDKLLLGLKFDENSDSII